MKHFSTLLSGAAHHSFTLLCRCLPGVLWLLAAPLARAQAPAWQTAVGLNGSGTSVVYATATDASGNIYATGGFSGTVTFGSTVLTSAGLRDVFVTKWNPATSSFAWAQRAGGSGEEYATSMAVSGNSVYLVGVFGSVQAVFGGTTLSNSGPTTGFDYDGYVAKLTDSGSSSSFTWAQRFGGLSLDTGNAVKVTGTSVYIAGVFTSPSADFGPFTLANTNPTSADSYDVYVAKLIDAGTSSSFGWAERIGGTGDDICSSIALSGSNIYLTGSFNGPTASMGSITLTNSNVIGENIFVTKLTDQGTAPSFVWGQRAGSSGTDQAQAIRIVASQNSVYIAGAFAGAPTTFGSIVLVSAGQTDAYVAKLTDAGPTASFTWAQQIGGSGYDRAYGLDVRGGSVYVAGYFENTVTLGPAVLTSQGAYDVFVARLADAGPTAQVVWAQQAGGTGSDALYSALIVGARVYVAGSIAPPASFGSLAVTSPASTEVGFLASITDVVGLSTTPVGPLAGTSLYPNPAHNTVTVQLPPVPGAIQATLTVVDVLGRAVRTATVALPATGLRHELDLTSVPAGLYAVQVAAGGRTVTHRLVVE